MKILKHHFSFFTAQFHVIQCATCHFLVKLTSNLLFFLCKLFLHHFFSVFQFFYFRISCLIQFKEIHLISEWKLFKLPFFLCIITLKHTCDIPSCVINVTCCSVTSEISESISGQESSHFTGLTVREGSSIASEYKTQPSFTQKISSKSDHVSIIKIVSKQTWRWLKIALCLLFYRLRVIVCWTFVHDQCGNLLVRLSTVVALVGFAGSVHYIMFV